MVSCRGKTCEVAMMNCFDNGNLSEGAKVPMKNSILSHEWWQRLLIAG